MAVLFFSSSQTYEQQSQVGLLSKLLKNEPFKESLTKVKFVYAGSDISIAAKGYASFIEFFIRKGAHFVTYFALGISWLLILNKQLKSVLLASVVSWLSATGYAGLDEFHQMVTGGRTPLVEDIMLDSVGALTGVVICLLILAIRQKK
nr:VanZ family protein [Vagococcus xieshaowenii]